MRIIAIAACLVLFSACKREEHTSHVDSVRVDSPIRTYDTIKAMSDSSGAVEREEIAWQCRSDLLGAFSEHRMEQGYIGVFRGQKLYYEVWDVYGAAGTSSNYILLRTDTVWNDTFDICLPQADVSDERDTVLIERWDSNETYRPAPSLRLRDVPSVLQVLLKYPKYGYQNYSSLNQDKEQRIYIKGNSLFIQHWDSPRYDDATLQLERYDYSESKERFLFKSVKVLKTEPWQ